MTTYHYVRYSDVLHTVLEHKHYVCARWSKMFSMYTTYTPTNVSYDVIVVDGESELLCMLILQGKAVAVSIDDCSRMLQSMLKAKV